MIRRRGIGHNKSVILAGELLRQRPRFLTQLLASDDATRVLGTFAQGDQAREQAPEQHYGMRVLAARSKRVVDRLRPLRQRTLDAANRFIDGEAGAGDLRHAYRSEEHTLNSSHQII